MSAATTTLSATTLPDPAGDEGRLTFISTWSTGSPERQRATLDAIARAWQTRAWPHEGLLSYTVYAGADGSTVLHHSRWRDEAAYQDFFASRANGRDARNAEIDAAVPGIERLGLDKTELYRSWTGGAGREAGAIVIVQADFEGPDPDRQRAWVDAVVDALDGAFGGNGDAGGSGDKGGLLAAHFHVSTDGTRVLNYAEWESEQAHIDALAAAGAGTADPGPKWRRVREFPGVTGDDTVARYRFAYRFVPSRA
ncbi:antibiotic biosynthesis monooxygenase [Streptomyces silaceus]|uniref:antibiotic biosynthesis monooxygenase n=1 Tax=Streptomyces silaceus TaxID=545123 RepID=UPI00099F268D|nr:antibiotic biosynthesis monooxygenase [Streptomyces silaceus]